MFCEETIIKLINIYRDDEKVLSIIERSITSFEEYHQAIFRMELWMKVYAKAVSGEEYKNKVSSLDKLRTTNHKDVLGNVNLLNRLAQKNDLAPVYDGVVSHEQPYRREVANAILDYVEKIIKERR